MIRYFPYTPRPTGHYQFPLPRYIWNPLVGLVPAREVSS